MRSHDDIPMVCSGSVIRCNGFSVQVDQTPVQVHELLADAHGFIELTFHDVTVYVDGSVVVAITPVFERISA